MRIRCAFGGQELAFTLLELLVLVAVLAVAAALASPAYEYIIVNTRMMTQIHDFDAALNLARSEAVKRGLPVTMCPSASLVPASATCSGQQWEVGWIMFVNKDVDNPPQFDIGSEDILHTSGGPLVTGYTLRASGDICTTSPCYVTMWPKGTISAPNAAFSEGQFVLCKGTGCSPSRAIEISNVGRITLLPAS